MGVTRHPDTALPVWTVRSEATFVTSEPHTVEQLHRDLPLPGSTCKRRCAEYGVYVHMIHCNCHDWVGRKLVCWTNMDELPPIPACPPLLLPSIHHPY